MVTNNQPFGFHVFYQTKSIKYCHYNSTQIHLYQFCFNLLLTILVSFRVSNAVDSGLFCCIVEFKLYVGLDNVVTFYVLTCY